LARGILQMKIQEKTFVAKNGRTILLRSPLESDTEAMLSFMRTLFHESYKNMNGPPDRFDLTTTEEEARFIKDHLDADRGFLITAFDADQIIGNLGLFGLAAPVSKHCGELGMGVLKKYHGLGIGGALMDHCLDEAKRIGLWNIRLVVRTFNKPAFQLYEKKGFVRVGTYKAVAKIGDNFEDEHIYQRLLER
jgi:RimJ/RimL family protein N-acetyltransferase